jgi:ribosome maturation factor RimP
MKDELDFRAGAKRPPFCIGMQTSHLEKKIATIIEPVIRDIGHRLVMVEVTEANPPIVKVLAERHNGTGINVDECGEISKAVSAILDVEDPIPSKYILEVSSPGINRPLVSAKDFDRFSGFEAKVKTDDFIQGRQAFRGKIIGLSDENNVMLEMDNETFSIPFDAIDQANLVLTDDLIEKGADAFLIEDHADQPA